jgi:hypothetical protein
MEVDMGIVVFGANGQTGRLRTRHALTAGHRVTAVTRQPADFPLTGSDLTVARVDVREAAAVAEVVADADVVLSALGVSFTRQPVDTYSIGTGNIIAGMRSADGESAHTPTRRRRFPLALRLLEPARTRARAPLCTHDIQTHPVPGRRDHRDTAGQPRERDQP